MISKETTGVAIPKLKRRSNVGLTSIFNRLIWICLVLFLLTSLATAQPVQTIAPESQLASIVCRNPTEETTNELLLNKNAQLVNITLWNTLINCASSAQRQGLPAKSIQIYKLTLRVAERLNKPELTATTYYHLGRTYAVIDDFENAIQATETSRKLLEQVGVESNLILVLADLGALYFAAADYEKAKSCSERALAMVEQLKLTPTKDSLEPVEHGRARALHTLGEIDLHHGKHAEALRKLNEARKVYERIDDTSTSYIRIADVLVALAKVYGEMGQYGKALSHLTKAHQVSKSSGDQNIRANIMSNQAALFLEQEDYAAAQKYFNQSLATYKSLRSTRKETQVLLHLAVIEQRQDHHDNALHLFQQSMERARTTNFVDVQIAAGGGLGFVLTAKRDFPKALQALNQSLELARRMNAKTREAELLWRAAQTYYAMRNYHDSAALAEQALTLARSLKLPKLTYLATAALGEAYAADDKVELAITTLKEAVDQIEELRHQVPGRQQSRFLFFENKVGPYQTLVKLLTRQGKHFEALVYAERAKARVLLETVRSNRTDLKDIHTDREKAEANSLINRLHAIKQRIESQPSSESKVELQNELNAVRRELVLFQEKLAAAHPDLLLRTGLARPLSQANVNSLVRAEDLAYLEYVVTGDSVGVFILKRNGPTRDHDLKYIKLPVTTVELRQKVDEFRSAVAARDPDYDSLGRELYRLLIAPVANELKNIRTVCIIPDEFLWTLPFQALTTSRGNYLIQEYSLFYAPSLSVLSEMALRRQQQTSKESLIAFGNPVNLKRDLHPIPETGVEVAAVARAIRPKVTKVLVGARAEEKSFKTLTPEYATIHVASHGLLDNRDPLSSYLLLAGTEGDGENDGLLTAREIIDLRLNADLAVLSACETASGRISPGEGVISMSWAFLVAGARSVVVSQWRVNSGSTSQLMKNFYQAMARQNDLHSRDKSQALRDASLQLLKDRRYRHPFYWAGFVLVSSN